MSTKILPFHPTAHPVPKPVGTDVVYSRFAQEVARTGLPLREPIKTDGRPDEYPTR